jgi:hypothetical protein
VLHLVGDLFELYMKLQNGIMSAKSEGVCGKLKDFTKRPINSSILSVSWEGYS